MISTSESVFLLFLVQPWILGPLMFWDIKILPKSRSGGFQTSFLSYLVSGKIFARCWLAASFSKKGPVFQLPNKHYAWEKIQAVLEDGALPSSKWDEITPINSLFFTPVKQTSPGTNPQVGEKASQNLK